MNALDYQKGFNEGYLLTKHYPDLSNKLADIKSEAPRMEGFRDGRKEFILEKAKDFLPTWLNKEDDKGPEKYPNASKKKEDSDKDFEKD